MHVREWSDIVADVAESTADADGWRAVGGPRRNGVGEVLYLGHPEVGLYHLRTYARNPAEIRGVGTRVARSIDDDIETLLPGSEADARFALQTTPADRESAEATARRVEETVRAHADAPTEPNHLFADLMDAVDAPAFGPATFDLAGRPERVDRLDDRFEASESVLDAELDDLIEADGVDRGFQ